MTLEILGSRQPLKPHLARLGVDSGGLKIMTAKSRLHFIRIRDLHVGAANILKQDALSIGADLAVPKGTVTAQTPTVDAILIASSRHLEQLSRKELAQPYGLKTFARALDTLRKATMPQAVAVMGIINANDDSFFPGSRAEASEVALQKARQMIAEGAAIIDIGAVSTRPGSLPVDAAEELRRIVPVIDRFYAEKLHETVALSIDSYTPEVIDYVLPRGVTIVNDITGLENPRVRHLVAEHGATAVIMHMQGTPQTMQENPRYDRILSEIGDFFARRIEMAERDGIRDLILDVGIGFGKRLEDNLDLIAHLEHFLPFGHPLLVGASRKSMIDKIDPTPVQERLGGTLALHLKAAENGAAILRVHDVREHVQALKVLSALQRR